MIGLSERMADIQRRIMALKANRPVRISQIKMLRQSFTQSVTLGSEEVATFRVTIECAGAPIADIAYTGFASVGTGIIPSSTQWQVSGNTAIALCELTNVSNSFNTRSITFIAYAINGLSASIVRTG